MFGESLTMNLLPFSQGPARDRRAAVRRRVKIKSPLAGRLDVLEARQLLAQLPVITPVTPQQIDAVVGTPTNLSTPPDTVVAQFQFQGLFDASGLIAEVGFGDGTTTTFGDLTSQVQILPAPPLPVETSFTLRAFNPQPGPNDGFGIQPGNPFLPPPPGAEADLNFIQEQAPLSATVSGVFSFSSTTSQFLPIAGFDTSLLAGRLLGSTAANQPFVTLGANAVSRTRGIVNFDLTSNRVVQNLPGEDFVIFELASPEPVAVRVTFLDANNRLQTTNFFYTPFRPYQYNSAPGLSPNPITTNRTNAASFDFSDLGVPANAFVTNVEVINLYVDDQPNGVLGDAVPNTFNPANPTVVPVTLLGPGDPLPPGTIRLPQPPGFSPTPAVSGPDIQFAAPLARRDETPQQVRTQVTVTAPHTFNTPGTFAGLVNVRDFNGNEALLPFTSVVDNLPLTLGVPVVNPIQTGQAVAFPGNVIATAANPTNSPLPVPGFYRAVVDWGDGTPTTEAAVLDIGNNGVLDIVIPPHVYDRPGLFDIRVSLFTADGVRIDTGTTRINVEGDPIVPPGQQVIAGPQIAINDVVENEGNGTITFTVTRTGTVDQLNQFTRVDFTTAQLPNFIPAATAGVDFVSDSGTGPGGVIAGQILFRPGETQATIRFTLIDDNIYEFDESFAVRLSQAVNGTLNMNGMFVPATEAVITRGEGTGTIVDNDAAPVIRVEGARAVEGLDAGLVFRVFLPENFQAERPVSVNYFTTNGTAQAGLDYVPAFGTLVFAPGETEKFVFVEVIDDGVPAGAPGELAQENLFLNLVSPGGGATIGVPRAEGVILDRVVTTPPTVSISDAQVVEGGVLEFTIQLSHPALVPVEVSLATFEGFGQHPATAGTDFLSTTQTIRFDPGTTTAVFRVQTQQDTIYEFDETLAVRITNLIGAVPGRDQALGTIVDNDQAPEISVADAQAFERVDGGLVFRVFLPENFQAERPVSVNFFTEDGTALAGLDYQAVAGTLTFLPGETEKTIFVPIFDDRIPEPIETMRLVLTDPQGGAILGNEVATGRILENANPPLITISDALAVEGQDLVFTVRLSHSPITDVVINYSTFDGVGMRPATSSDDFVPVAGTLVFPAFTTQLTREIRVATVQDTIREFDETMAVRLTGVVFGAIVDGEGIGTIVDNEAPQPTIVISNAKVREGAFATLDFVVTLVDANGNPVTAERPVSVSFTTLSDPSQGDTAQQGVDFQRTSGVLTFLPGESAKTISVPVIDDNIDEFDEFMRVQLFAPVNGVLGQTANGLGIGRGTIIDSGDPILDLQRLGFHLQPTQIVIQFKTPLDPASAENVDNYRLFFAPRNNRRPATAFDREIQIVDAIYDPDSQSVVLIPAQRLKIHGRYRLIINGNEPLGLRNQHGFFLNNTIVKDFFGRTRDTRRGVPGQGVPPGRGDAFGPPPPFRPGENANIAQRQAAQRQLAQRQAQADSPSLTVRRNAIRSIRPIR